MTSRDSRGFALLVAGNIVSTFGSSIYLITLVLYLARQSDSPEVVGFVQFLAYLPAALVGPVAGALVDRWDRRTVVIWADLIRGVAMLATAAFGLVAGEIPIWLLMTATVAVSACGVFFVPAVQAIMPQLVAASRLKAANAVRTASAQIANMAGSAVGGVLYVVLGAPLVIGINGVSFLLSGVSESFITPQRARRSIRPPVLRSAVAGLRLFARSRSLLALASVQAFVNLLLPPLVVSLPFAMSDYWSLPDSAFGIIMALVLAGGVASFVALGSPRVGRVSEERAYHLAMPAIGLSISLLGFLLLRPGLPLTVLTAALTTAAFLAGAGIGALHLVGTTTLQRLVPPRRRGRVFAAIETVTSALLPVAYAVSGVLTQSLRERLWVLYFAAALAAFAAALAMWRVRPLSDGGEAMEKIATTEAR